MNKEESCLQLIDNGGSTLIYLKDSNVLKAPLLLGTNGMSEDDHDNQEYINQGNRTALQRESEVYERLGTHVSIAQYLGCSEEGILLKYYSRGNLQRYIKDQPEISTGNKARWILSLVEAYAHIHQRRVLVYDAALRNILISDDFTLKLIDFAQSTCIDMSADINTVADEDGMTAKCNIFDLGTLVYSIAVWEEFKCDLFETHFILPPIKSLPDTRTVFCGDIIRHCWSGGFENMEAVEREARPLLEDIMRADGQAKPPASIIETVCKGFSHLAAYFNYTVRYRT